jgi:hypothetical protein
VAPSTVWEIRKKHGIDPAPRRSGPTWAQLPRSQAEAIIARDFFTFTVDLLDGTLIRNLPHLCRVLRDYETHHNTHRPHTALAGAAPDKPPLPGAVDLDAFRTRKHDRAGGAIREYHRAA